MDGLAQAGGGGPEDGRGQGQDSEQGQRQETQVGAEAMRVESVEPLFDGEKIKFLPYDPDNPEDTAFSQYTPSGEMELYI